MKPRTTNQPDLFSGVFVPRLVLEDNRLTAPARILFGVLDGLGKSERGCYASCGYLARIVSVKPRQLRNLLSDLERLGYITRTPIPGGGRILKTVTSQALQTVQGGRQWIAGGGGNGLPTYRIEDKHNPLTPLKGGKVKRALRARNRKRLTGEDYGNGF